MYSARKGVFETNSSSTHSLAIAEDACNDTWSVKEALEQLKRLGATDSGNKYDKTLSLASINPRVWEFYRSYEVYNDFGVKLLYALVSFKNDAVITQGILSFLKTFLGIDEIILPYSCDNYSGTAQIIGDIDHESEDMLISVLGKSLTIEKYLVSKDIYLIIDNEG